MDPWLLVAQVDPASEVPTTLLRWAFQQGGLAMAFVVLVFFYRRDSQRQETERNRREDEATKAREILINVLLANTKATTEMTGALAQNTVVFHKATRVMETYLPTIELQQAGARAVSRRNGEAIG